jgi:hypothetical protein
MPGFRPGGHVFLAASLIRGHGYVYENRGPGSAGAPFALRRARNMGSAPFFTAIAGHPAPIRQPFTMSWRDRGSVDRLQT